MEITIEGRGDEDFERLAELEWLETNGLGGWASSTVSGAHSRRYHGLLVAATEPPVGRTVLLSKLDEIVHVEGAAWDLGCNRYPGAVHPHGYRHLTRFRRGLFPVFEYQAGGAHLRKTVAAVAGENTTLVVYELVESSGPVELELLPLLTWRNFHSLGPATVLSEQTDFEDGLFISRPTADGPTVHLQVPGADFDSGPDWYRGFEFEVERRRGLDFREDLWTPGTLRRRLDPGERLGIVISTEDPRGRDAVALLDEERERRQRLLADLSTEDPATRLLSLAADQFVVHRGADLRTLIAGYHWFADWGRDTMIALPGICLATGRLEDAKRILAAFAASVDKGMLPNRFPDAGETPEYNTVDATLWFFVAIHQYLEQSNDAEFVRGELLPVLREILSWHDAGTRYGIHTDEDGLLLAGEPGVQLTWMDAKVDDWVVTPRQGKAVEINALWYNALRILGELEVRLGDEESGCELGKRAERVRRRFNRLFWNEELGCLYDVVEDGRADPSIRPNQLFALTLPYPLLAKTKALKVLRVVQDKLLTPVGLRSLSPDHPDYRPIYVGGPLERDGSYHQGTVWSWLLGPYVDALLRYRGEAGRKEARGLLDEACGHLSEAGVGTVSEIFDAEPPHTPRGAVAQAWSVGELLRARIAVAVPARIANPAPRSAHPKKARATGDP